METTVKQRLIKYLHLKGISQRKFEIAIGLSNGYVNNINKSIQPDKIQKITLFYPDLNTGWLLTGEGRMLRDGIVSDCEPESERACKNCQEKDKKISELKSKVIELQDELLKKGVAGVEGTVKNANAV